MPVFLAAFLGERILSGWHKISDIIYVCLITAVSSKPRFCSDLWLSAQEVCHTRLTFFSEQRLPLGFSFHFCSYTKSIFESALWRLSCWMERVSEAAYDAPSLEIVKVMLDGSTWSATWSSSRCPGSLQGAWARWPWKCPSNPKHSIILWFQDSIISV